MKIMDFLMLDCFSATKKISKKMDEKLSLKENIQLESHLIYCKKCKRFEIQTKKIDEILKMPPEKILEKTSQNIYLNLETREKIINKIKNKINQ